MKHSLRLRVSHKRAFSLALLAAMLVQPLFPFAAYADTATSTDPGASSTPAAPLIDLAPSAPVISSGTTAGQPNVSYTFSATASDPENEQVDYGFDWDNDGVVDTYTGYVNSGTSGQMSHMWTADGTYTFSVVARDPFSHYSNPTTETVTIATPANTGSTGGSASTTASTGSGSGSTSGSTGSTGSTGGSTPSAPSAPTNGNVNTAPNAPTVIFNPAGLVNATQSFTASAVDPQGDQVTYGFDWNSDGVVDQWTGYVPSGTPSAASYTWTQPGAYTVSVYAKDPWGAVSNAYSLSVNIVNQASNTAPSAPTVTASGDTAGSPVTFSATASDPQGDQVAYGFDWNNDGVVDQWTGFVTSGTAGTASNTWTQPGTYSYSVYAKDPWGAVSNAFSGSIAIVNPTNGGGNGGNTGGNGGNTGGNTGGNGGNTGGGTGGGGTTAGGSISSFSVNPASITSGGTTTLSWSASNATLCVASGDWSGALALSGSQIVGPFTTGSTAGAQNFTLSCGNQNGTSTQSVTIAVNPASSTNGGGNNGGGSTSGGGTGGSTGGGTSSGGGGGTYTGPCFGFNCPASGPTSPLSTGSSGSSSGTISPSDIQILIGSLAQQGAVGPSAPELVCPSVNFIRTFLRAGVDNDPTEVKKLQYFLNSYEGANLPLDGIFGSSTEDAVKAFQAKYSSDILAPWGTTTPTGIVYLTTSRKINSIYCTDHPGYAGSSDLKDILGPNVSNSQPNENPGQFQGVVGQATSTSFNIAGVLGAFNQRLLDSLKGIPIYQLLILILLIAGIGFIIQGLLIKDIGSYRAYAGLMRGAAVLTVATVLNVLNTLSFILNPDWLARKTGLGLSWVLALDMANGVAVIVISLSVLAALYSKISKLQNK